jgi:4-hydroxybenzoate polyprenyltransferase
VYATSLAAVFTSLLCTALLPWTYALVAVPAAAYLLAAVFDLRERADAASAGRTADRSVRYLWALLAALALSAL